MMKNIWIYHLVTGLPVFIFFYWWLTYSNSGISMILFGLLYPFVYRPLMDFYRLKALGELKDEDKSKMWKWGTLYSFKYYKKLMFGK